MDTIPQTVPQDKPYVYTLAYPESMGGYVFYIGKGTGDRIDEHEIEARRGKSENIHKINVIRKIWEAGGQVAKKKIDFFDTHREALLYESALILRMRSNGHLTNIIDRPDGYQEVSLYPLSQSVMPAGLRKTHQNRVGFNLLGQYLEYLYGELGITSDKELARISGIHQTTISTIKRTHHATEETLSLLLRTLQTYPNWDDRYRYNLFIAANHAVPEERQMLERRLQKVDTN